MNANHELEIKDVSRVTVIALASRVAPIEISFCEIILINIKKFSVNSNNITFIIAK